ncbi:ecdysteroid-phosphate phosphatase-like isoform X2 [Ornithodoros turicata]|uniref:ecdysteroid-phosphate phosphatase-like isoform X2 n=1 Tax=Ornithodoros turicata TaxID=34597 RepID=UPI0031396591
MASPPPRRNVSTRPHRQHLSPLQVLLQMGFPKHRAEKALAATGDRGVQLAADWLLAHVNDPTLDDSTPREYILYLCPTGPLLEQLQSFFLQSMLQCNRNGAHNYLPHITLCSFFQAPDDAVSHLTRALQHVVEKLRPELPDHIRLEHYTSPTFLGLFVAEEHNDPLKKVAVHFMREVSEFSIQVEPYLKALHITLAYQFQPDQCSQLEKLGQDIDCTAAACWELRLYSRDTRIKGCEVHKVLYSHVAKEPDELELLIGDYVYVGGEQLGTSPDGWIEGTSWLTGCTGFLPKNYIERTAESDAWTLHRSITIAKNAFMDGLDSTMLQRRPLNTVQALERSPPPSSNVKEEEKSNTAQVTQESKDESIYENLSAIIQRSKTAEAKNPDPRKLFVVRHAERVDFTFGIWIPMAFDETGKYKRTDLNMPVSVPSRRGGFRDFVKDCPLTNIGLHQASLVGNALSDNDVKFTHAFSSPALRCIQTCHNIIKAIGQIETVPICVEPGLFEWLAWYQDGMPTWMSIDEMLEAGYNIKGDYKPVVAAQELMHKKETSEQYYMRSFYVSQALLNHSFPDSDHRGNVLFVGHAATLDTCTRQLTRKNPRTAGDLIQIVQRIPYCSVAVAEESPNGAWTLVAPPVPALTHSSNGRYDWRCML